MIRSSKHILKYQTNKKNDLLNISIELLQKQIQKYIELICNGNLSLKKLISSKDLSNDFISHSRWKQVCYKTASEMIRSQIKQASNKRYKKYKKLYFKCIKNNKHKIFTSKKYSDLKLKSIYLTKYFTIPKFNNFSINIDNRFFDFQKSKYFDEFIKIILPIFNEKKTRALQINIPVKQHRQSLKYQYWTRLNTIRLILNNNKLFLEIIYEKEEPKLKEFGNIIGIDQGVKKLLSCSNGLFLGSDFESKIINKIDKKKHNSNKYKKALIERTEYINKIIKQLDFFNIKEIVIEDLKYLKYKQNLGRKNNRRFNLWCYPQIISRLESLCQENGVLLTKVNSAYTSQLCSNCGTIDKSNRKGEIYQCSCGLIIDADLNASINLSRMGKYGSHIHEKQLLEKINNKNFIDFHNNL